MYYHYFGLKEAPFSIAPNPSYLFMTERHQEALAHLYHGIESDAGFVLLTGDIGTGKTTVCRRFLNYLPDNTQLAFILNPCLDGIELLQAIAKELQIDSVPEQASLRQLTDLINEHLLANHAQGINTVLLIEEAQQLHHNVLELIRLLTNLETDTQKLLKIILVGQPELNDILAKPELVQLSQRITARYHIQPLSVTEIADYINFRLRTAGYIAEKKLFSTAIIKQLFLMTKGVPRLVNVICDRALLGVYSQNRKVVNKAILSKACQEVRGNYQTHTSSPSNRWWFMGLGLTTAMVLSVLSFTHWKHYIPQVPPSWLELKTSMQEIVLEKTPTQEPTIISATYSDDENIVDESEVTIAQVEEVIAEAPVLPIAERYQNKSQALSALLTHVVPSYKAITSDNTNYGCLNIEARGWQCVDQTVLNWSDFKKINRPSVITLFDRNTNTGVGANYYMNIIGITPTHAQVLADQGMESIPLVVLGENWSGEFSYLWQPPTGFSRYIYKNSSEDLIDWLAQAFATIDGQQEVLAKKQYNNLLKQRITLFQRKNQLKEDGKAGVETLLKLNEALGIAITLDGLSKRISLLQPNYSP